MRLRLHQLWAKWVCRFGLPCPFCGEGPERLEAGVYDG